VQDEKGKKALSKIEKLDLLYSRYAINGFNNSMKTQTDNNLPLYVIGKVSQDS
jgi:hypothetical protein